MLDRAEEVVRDYVQRNFVDKGMCADWAIHDSENDKGQLIEVPRIKGAYAEVIGYNKKNLERELQNESRQHNRQQGRPKRRRKKFNENSIEI